MQSLKKHQMVSGLYAGDVGALIVFILTKED